MREIVCVCVCVCLCVCVFVCVCVLEINNYDLLSGAINNIFSRLHS